MSVKLENWSTSIDSRKLGNLSYPNLTMWSGATLSMPYGAPSGVILFCFLPIQYDMRMTPTSLLDKSVISVSRAILDKMPELVFCIMGARQRDQKIISA